MARGTGAGNQSASEPQRRTKNERRIAVILSSIPEAREQLMVAIEDIQPSFTVEAIARIAESSDARERNKIAALRGNVQELIQHLDELAARGLSEAQRLGRVKPEKGYPFDRLAALGVISKASAARLTEIKEVRNDLVHDYPPSAWHTLQSSAEALVQELDRFVVGFSEWARKIGIASL